jgi:hypothetical protein
LYRAFALTCTLTLAAMLAPASPASTSAATLARFACPGYAPDRSAIGLPEVRGVIAHGQLWALLFNGPPARTRTDLKIAIRMTGHGPLHVVARSPRGGTIHPIWGPEAHGGSNWTRPGDEWGTGWRLPTPGCWHLHATRNNVSGDIWLRVIR